MLMLSNHHKKTDNCAIGCRMSATFFLLVIFVWSACALADSSSVYLTEGFDSANWQSDWIVPSGKSDLGKWHRVTGKFIDASNPDAYYGLATSEDARFYALSKAFDKKLTHEGRDAIFQFTVKFEQNIDCGGGYIKVLPPSLNPKKFDGDSQYNVMFGPDICGPTKSVHVILNHNGKNLDCKKKLVAKSDQLSHVYTLILKKDLTYVVLVDGAEEATGSVLEDWDILPPEKIEDPDASKPDDWEDNPKIPDPEAEKPADWDDEPEFVTDPDAQKPEEWDDDMDGDWEPRQIRNPEHKGKWKAPMIDNVNYKGAWEHPEIENPDYAEAKKAFKGLDFVSNFVGLDLWQVKSGTHFDDFLVTDSIAEATKHRKDFWEKKQPAELAAKEEKDAAETPKEDPLSAKVDEDEDEDDEDDEDTEEESANKLAAKKARKAQQKGGNFFSQIRHRITSFLLLAQKDPIRAFKEKPLAGGSIFLIFLLPVLFVLFSKSPSASQLEQKTKEKSKQALKEIQSKSEKVKSSVKSKISEIKDDMQEEVLDEDDETEVDDDSGDVEDSKDDKELPVKSRKGRN